MPIAARPWGASRLRGLLEGLVLVHVAGADAGVEGDDGILGQDLAQGGMGAPGVQRAAVVTRGLVPVPFLRGPHPGGLFQPARVADSLLLNGPQQRLESSPSVRLDADLRRVDPCDVVPVLGDVYQLRSGREEVRAPERRRVTQTGPHRQHQVGLLEVGLGLGQRTPADGAEVKRV